jgi:hypothetical protein
MPTQYQPNHISLPLQNLIYCNLSTDDIRLLYFFFVLVWLFFHDPDGLPVLKIGYYEFTLFNAICDDRHCYDRMDWIDLLYIYYSSSSHSTMSRKLAHMGSTSEFYSPGTRSDNLWATTQW